MTLVESRPLIYLTILCTLPQLQMLKSTHDAAEYVVNCMFLFLFESFNYSKRCFYLMEKRPAINESAASFEC